MRGAFSFGGRGFGDASGFGDVDDLSMMSAKPPRQSQRPRIGGFGDAEGFGDAGGFDLDGYGRRRTDRAS